MSSSTRLIALGTVVVCGAFAPAAVAAGPTYIAGNPTCSDVDASWSQLKLDNDPAAGNHNIADGSISGTVTIDANRQYASFDIPAGVDAVLVKGSPAANLYTYDPDATSDSGLHAPLNPITGLPHQISHISFCYGAGGPDSTPQPQPSPDAAAQPQPQPAQQGQPTSNPQIHVKDALIVSGASVLSGPSSCASKAFKIKLKGRRIATVKVSIDGRTVKSFTDARGATKRFSMSVNPAKYGNGRHKLTARVGYAKASATKARTHRLVFERCARQVVQPTFLG